MGSVTVIGTSTRLASTRMRASRREVASAAAFSAPVITGFLSSGVLGAGGGAGVCTLSSGFSCARAAPTHPKSSSTAAAHRSVARPCMPADYTHTAPLRNVSATHSARTDNPVTIHTRFLRFSLFEHSPAIPSEVEELASLLARPGLEQTFG